MFSALDKVPSLTGQFNYYKWAPEVRDIAVRAELWGAFTGANTAPPGADVAQLEWIDDCEMQAQGLILMTSSFHIRLELKNLKIVATAATATSTAVTRDPTAKEMWDYLESKFKKRDGLSAAFDFRRLVRATLVDDGTLEAQLDKMTELRAAAAAGDATLEDWQFAAVILTALPQSYQHISESLLATGAATTLDPAVVRSRILEAEALRNSNRNKKGKGKRPPKPPPGVGDCKHCGKPGHWANRCREKPKQGNNQVPVL